MGVREIYFATEGGERIETKRTTRILSLMRILTAILPYEFV